MHLVDQRHIFLYALGQGVSRVYKIQLAIPFRFSHKQALTKIPALQKVKTIFIYGDHSDQSTSFIDFIKKVNCIPWRLHNCYNVLQILSTWPSWTNSAVFATDLHSNFHFHFLIETSHTILLFFDFQLKILSSVIS